MAFLRKISLNIYVAGVLYKTYVSDGSRNTIGISFSIKKTIVGQPNESTIVLTNVSPETRALLMGCSNRDKVNVQLMAGYEDEGLVLLASGDLVKMWPEKNGVENTFTLYFLDSLEAMQFTNFGRTFAPYSHLNSIVLDLAWSFREQGVTVDLTKIQLEGRVGARGYTVSGRTAVSLDQLAASYGFTWSIQDGVFQAYMDASARKESSQRVYKVSVKEKNLLKATPELGEKYMQQIGMKIEAVLNPKCTCADYIDLESIVYPQYNGRYQIHEIVFTGDTKGGDWKMEIDSKTIVR